MALFLQRRNNLADVEDIEHARLNLGLGSLSVFNSNDVHITGGSIRIDSLTLKSSNAKSGRFLVCNTDTGLLDFSEVNLGPWIHKDPMDIKISEFNHDDYIFLNKESLCNLAFTADYNDIELNKPNLYSDLSNDLDYLYRDLRNVDVIKARSNLGIGTLALRNSEDAIVFKQLHITDNVTFLNAVDTTNPNAPNKFLYVQNDGSAYWDTMPIATSQSYGVVKLSDDYTSSDSNTAPTIFAVNTMYNDLKQMIDNVEAGNVSQAINVIETINTNGIMKKENNLSELTNLVYARSNLGFGSNMERLIQSINTSNAFTVTTLRVSSNVFFQEGISTTANELETELLVDATYLAVNSDGNVVPRNIPLATTSTPGFVYIQSTYDYTENIVFSQDRSTVLSAQAFDQFVKGVYIPLYQSISNSVEPRIRELYGSYLKVSDNLLVDNPAIARQNLGLHPIAHTGDYFQLNNRPTSLSAFTNEDTKYLVAESNLSDLTNIAHARSNLKLGSMSFYDSNNVMFVKGNGSFSNLIIKSNVQYKYDNENHNQHFLQCINTNGDAKWSALPEATSTKKGIVSLESDYTKVSDTKASSGAALYKMYHRLMGEINMLQREVNELRKLVEP